MEKINCYRVKIAQKPDAGKGKIPILIVISVIPEQR